MLIKLYRRTVPYWVRKKTYDMFLGKFIFFIRHFTVIIQSKFIFIFRFILPKTEVNEAFSFIGRYGINSYPYLASLKYRDLRVKVHYDSLINLPFVIHNDKRLYFPEFYTFEKITRDYKALLVEQDSQSPHRYVRSYEELKGRILLDIGSAEGIFALDSIEHVEKAYLFECAPFWLRPLKFTFEPWAEKTQLIHKYVGDTVNRNTISLDEFLKNMPIENIFIKMDIEGAERTVLRGAKNTLEIGQDMRFSICTYHRKNDPEFIFNLLSSYGYVCEFSEGLMFWDKRLSKGIIRCRK